MWKSFKFYLAIVCMCIACLVPASMFSLPEDQYGLPGAFLVFGAGGGLLYCIYALCTESYDDRWKEHHDLVVRIMTTVFSVLSIGLQILMNVLYKGTGFVIYDLLVDFKGDVTELMLKVLTIVISGLAVFSLYSVMVGNIDTEMYVWVKTTYVDGVATKQEIVTQSSGESKASFFFTTLLVASFGMMASTPAIAIFLLLFNLAGFFSEKVKFLPYIIGGVLALAIVIYRLYNIYSVAPGPNGYDVPVALELMPVFYLLLMVLFLKLYFSWEWVSHPIFLIVACTVMIFVSYLAGLGVSYLLSTMVIPYV